LSIGCVPTNLGSSQEATSIDHSPLTIDYCQSAVDAGAFSSISKGNTIMNLIVWLIAMLALGILAMGLCYLFLIACEKI
jgi:hypothetical protein